MTTTLLIVFAIASVVVLLRAERLGFRTLAYTAKPLALVSIALIAVFNPAPVSSEYRLLILVGLALSLPGDILLMLPKDRFLAGLFAFLLAHGAYSAAFLGRLEAVPILPMLPYAVALAFTVKLLWPHLGRLRWAVLFYGLALALMASLALGVATEVGGRSAILAAAGAALFVLSDTALAFDRFLGGYDAARYAILWPYFGAQLLLALSVAA